ncbi:MAG: hypothetical protein HC942_17560 [Microcoleus sp. SU_5_6]|nr:hypothetical protein [Microcoleus sp. SU_5_6]NJL69029.1 hypothetical protein [Microcoleus sp. SM1_3_4]
MLSPQYGLFEVRRYEAKGSIFMLSKRSKRLSDRNFFASIFVLLTYCTVASVFERVRYCLEVLKLLLPNLAIAIEPPLSLQEAEVGRAIPSRRNTRTGCKFRS